MGEIGDRDGEPGLIPQSLQQLLGLCQRAGKLASGDFAAEQALRKRKADLLIVAEDASEKTQEKFIGLAQKIGVRCYIIGTRDELSSALGKEGYRATVVVQSRDFKKGIEAILEREGNTPVKRGDSGGTEDSRI